jgi:hypothetical protein
MCKAAVSGTRALNWKHLQETVFNPECGLPLAALFLYITAVVQHLKVDGKQQPSLEW